jgi:hypothetical protein
MAAISSRGAVISRTRGNGVMAGTGIAVMLSTLPLKMGLIPKSEGKSMT